MAEKLFNNILGHINNTRIPLLTKKEIHDFVDQVQQLQSDNTKLLAEIVALEGVAEIMDCGHERRFSTLQIGATDNKSVCTACENERLKGLLDRDFLEVITELEIKVSEYDAVIVGLLAGFREQLDFKGNNPFVSHGDFDYLLNIARELTALYESYKGGAE